MSRLVFSNMVSLDGCCAGPGGDLGRLPMDPAFDAHNLALLKTAGALLFGRTTFCLFQRFWPQVEKEGSADPVLAEIAAINNRLDKLVVSDTLSLSATDPWSGAAIVPRAQVRARIRALKADTAGDVVAFGSHVLMNELLAQGEVDELRLLVANVVLGDGVRLFETSLPAAFSLTGHSRLEGSDTVVLRYACAPAAGT